MKCVACVVNRVVVFQPASVPPDAAGVGGVSGARPALLPGRPQQASRHHPPARGNTHVNIIHVNIIHVNIASACGNTHVNIIHQLVVIYT